MSKYKGFSSVQLQKPKRSYFDMSHQKRLSTRMGRLTPVFIQEAIPGDVWNGSSEILLRMAPLLAPIYDSIQLFVHYFFVPNRLLWEDWEEFITGGRLGVGIDPVDAPVPPWVNLETVIELAPELVQKSSLADYLGVPILTDINPTSANWAGTSLDVLPFMAYNLVWYEYYRDRNFISDDILNFPYPSGEWLPGGDEIFLNYTRCYLHDYFTSALPNTQRGVEVLMPVDNTLSGYAPVVSESDGSISRWELQAQVQPGGGAVELSIPSDSDAPAGSTTPTEPSESQLWASLGDVEDQTPGIAASINDFRAAYALQVWLERNEIAGSRYVESNLAHFGVRSQDSRLQRPEFLGGGRIPVKISEVVSTAYSSDGEDIVPLANMAGHGVTYGNTNRFKYFCPEHGFIIGIASIMNPPSYHQGLPRMFRRRSFLDYPWPTFAKLGEQQVNQFEIYCAPATLTESDGELPLFGYQSRYADWKHVANTSHGEFHDTLLFWTLTREFTGIPGLSDVFTRFDDSTQDRIFAVNGEEDNFWLYIHNKCGVKRALPYFGQPNTLGF